MEPKPEELATPSASSAPADATVDRPRRIIKRYSNRKLYDTKDSRYVTLLQIAEMVRTGEEVQIIDNNTKDDLTEVTLAQIIYEEQKAHSRNVPLQTLKELIHARTEKVLADLREGPIGRLIPGTKPSEESPRSRHRRQRSVEAHPGRPGQGEARGGAASARRAGPGDPGELPAAAAAPARGARLNERIEELEAQAERRAPDTLRADAAFRRE